MGLYTKLWSPRAGNFEVRYTNTEASLGTGGTSIGNSTTTSILLPVPGMMTTQSKAEVRLISLNVQGLVAAIMNASGTIKAQVFRRINAGTPSDQALTGTFDLSATGLSSLDWTFAFPITGTETNCLFLTTDACRIDVVTTDTVSTQPTALISAAWAIRKPA